MSVSVAVAAMLMSACVSPANAELYVGLAPAHVVLKTSGGRVSPTMGDLRLGYQLGVHKLELSTMSSTGEATLNALTVDVATANSIIYRYNSAYNERFNMDVSVSYSQFEVISSYVAVAPVQESYEGLGFGLGMEESLSIVKQLKVRLDYMQLYRSTDLTIQALTLGVRYVF